MSDGIWWRKIKRNVIRDDTMRMIAEELDDEAWRPLVLNFYIIAYMLADDDGVFNFGNGKIFKRLMYAPSLDAVIAIRDALLENGVIISVFGSSANSIDANYLIADWRDVNESPYKERPARTNAERRAAVAGRIAEAEEAQAAARNYAAQTRREILSAQKNRTAGTAPAPVVRVDFDAMRPALTCEDAQTCVAQNDKNTKNVVTDCFDDKNAKNVVTTHNKTIQDSTGQDSSVRSSAQSLQDSTAAVASQRAANTDKIPQDSTILSAADYGGMRSSAPACHDEPSGAVAPKGSESYQEDTPDPFSREERILSSKKCGVYDVLTRFFANPDVKLSENGEFDAFLLVCDVCVSLSSPKNNPQVVASMLTAQIRKLFPGEVVKPSRLCDPLVFLALYEGTAEMLSVDAEQAQKVLAEYNKRLSQLVAFKTQKAGKVSAKTAQSLAEQALSEDSG